MIAFNTRPHTRRQVQKVQVQTNCSVHSLGAALCLRPTDTLFYLTTIGRQFLFTPSPHFRSHTLPAAYTSGGLTAGNDERLL